MFACRCYFWERNECLKAATFEVGLTSNVDNQLVTFRSANDQERGLGNSILSGVSDAKFARDIDTRRSTFGFIFIFAGASISWRSRAQAHVALSSRMYCIDMCCSRGHI